MAKTPYNLDYKFNAQLREVPLDAPSMQAYLQFCQETVKAVPATAKNLKAIVKLLGDIGAYGKILGKLDVSQNALEKSLQLIDENKLSLSTWAVHSLRYGDTLRFKKDFLAAETAFRSVLELAKRHPEIQEMADFALQHLGKVRFDEGHTKEAIEFFQQALEIRQKKGIPELIESSQFALRVIQMKKPPMKKY